MGEAAKIFYAAGEAGGGGRCNALAAVVHLRQVVKVPHGGRHVTYVAACARRGGERDAAVAAAFFFFGGLGGGLSDDLVLHDHPEVIACWLEKLEEEAAGVDRGQQQVSRRDRDTFRISEILFPSSTQV